VTNVLIVDDDSGLRSMLRADLEPDGFRVFEANDAELALYEFGSNVIDVVLIDIRLPGMSGIELSKEIRRRGETPIVAISAQTSTADIVACFVAGADDYIAKPFAMKELRRRLGALLPRGRSEPEAGRSIIAGDLVIRLPAGKIERAGERVPLGPLESSLLAALAEHPGGVVSGEELAERVWGPGQLGDLRVIDEHVDRLRRVLATAGLDAVVVDSVGDGYRLTWR
jgi:DNA-binding response OmpR family regulator